MTTTAVRLLRRRVSFDVTVIDFLPPRMALLRAWYGVRLRADED
jgi:hypothetical protein